MNEKGLDIGIAAFLTRRSE